MAADPNRTGILTPTAAAPTVTAPAPVMRPRRRKARPIRVRTAPRRVAVPHIAAGAWWPLFLLALTIWLWTDGPQSYIGTGSWTRAIIAFVGGRARPGVPVQLVLYLMLTVSTNILWFYLAATWRWFRATWLRLLLGLPVYVLLVLVPLTFVDVGKGAAGFYELFAPLNLSAIHWELATAALVETAIGSVLAQVVVMVMVGQRWGQR